MATATQTSINFKRLGERLESAVFAARAGTQPPRSGALLILDLHGVLVNRVSKSKNNALFKQTRQYRMPWRSLRGYAIWLRPFLREFLEVVMARHEIAVWSSAQMTTIDDLFRHVSAEYGMRPSLKERFSFVWGREHCRLDHELGGHATVKFLADLWTCDRVGGRYNPSNTLLLDDSPAKFRHFPLSGIAVPPYSADQVGDDFNRDDTLLWLLLYIEYLLEKSTLFLNMGRTIDIASIRLGCMDFGSFVAEGRRQAYQLSNRSDRKKSVAFVFFRGLSSSFTSDSRSMSRKAVPSTSGDNTLAAAVAGPGTSNGNISEAPSHAEFN